ncbi:unnamed protein product [Urochloa decumbens]|uniref:Replication factor A C-terminal domain-containing protein n=1 Tax=Urochloa decumbens TaxID=240449 RepID=A0ABC9G1L7_9POAL
MAIDLLSDIRPRQYHWTICVRISRIWEFHGRSDDEEIKHLDLVIIDKKGTSMYVEIPPDSIPFLKHHLQEGKIVVIKKFVVEQAKPTYRVVQNPYMIKLNKRTEITPVEPEPAIFPKVTCMLTPFSELEQHRNLKDKFLDVIGQIVAVLNVANFHTAAGKTQTRRTVTLRDISGMTVNLSLAGSRAIEFDGDAIYELGQETPVIAIFVGTLMKGTTGQPSYLTGTSACRWYINDFQIPVIQEYYNMLPSEVDAVEKIELIDNNARQQHVEQKTLLQLKDMDPYVHLNTRLQCTVTITKLAPNQGWYYLACKICNSRSYYKNSAYKCSKDTCPCTEAEDRYKLAFMAADETYELEFVVFDQKAQQLIGKPLQRLQSMYNKFDTPSEISNLIGQRYTFIVKMSAKKSMESDEPSYDVIYIKEQFGRQPNIPVFQKTNSLTAISSSQAVQRNIPSPIPMEPKKIQRKIQHHGININDPSKMQYQHTTDNKQIEVEAYDISNKNDKEQNLGTKRERSSDLTDDENSKGNQSFPGSSKRHKL